MNLYDDIAADLELRCKFDPLTHVGNQQTAPYALKRSLIESVDGGSDYFITEGALARITQPGVAPNTIQDQRQFEGWRHENP